MLGMEPPVISCGKFEGQLVILVIVLSHIDMEAVAAEIMEGPAGDLLLLCAGSFADIAALRQLFLDLGQILLLQGDVQSVGDGLQMIDLGLDLRGQSG